MITAKIPMININPWNPVKYLSNIVVTSVIIFKSWALKCVTRTLNIYPFTQPTTNHKTLKIIRINTRRLTIYTIKNVINIM